MTEATPMMIPSIVSSDRIVLAFSEANATPKTSVRSIWAVNLRGKSAGVEERGWWSNSPQPFLLRSSTLWGMPSFARRYLAPIGLMFLASAGWRFANLDERRIVENVEGSRQSTRL